MVLLSVDVYVIRLEWNVFMLSFFCSVSGSRNGIVLRLMWNSDLLMMFVWYVGIFRKLRLSMGCFLWCVYGMYSVSIVVLVVYMRMVFECDVSELLISVRFISSSVVLLVDSRKLN